jgi:hypothetical protein
MADVKRKLPEGTRPLKLKKGKEKEDDTFRLPTKLSVPVTDLTEYSLFLFGEKKIGKTTLLSNFPKAVFLMTEPGGKSLSIYQTPVRRWRQFKKAVAQLEKDTKFKTVIVDTVDLLFKMCETYVCDKLGVDHVSEADWGRGWGALRDEFSTQIQRLMSIEGKGVVFVSHAVEKKIKRGRNGPEYDRVVATLGGQGKDIIEGLVDMWFYYTYDDNRRVLVIEGDEHISAGHRLTDHFKDTKGRSIREIPMGGTHLEAYSRFMQAFDNQMPAPKKATIPDDEPVKPLKKKRV